MYIFPLNDVVFVIGKDCVKIPGPEVLYVDHCHGVHHHPFEIFKLIYIESTKMVQANGKSK